MDVLTLLIAVVALVIAILAFQRTGGIHDLRRQMDDLSEKTEHATKGAREVTADALGRLETLIRGQQKPEKAASTDQETSEDQASNTEHKP